MKLILASKSPRRTELLSALGLSPEICPADVDETLGDQEKLPQTAVMSLARRKAEHVSEKYDGDALIIAADTLVYNDGALLGKPRSESEAYAMLSSLSSSEHSVFTGICAIYGKKTAVRAVETKVRFRALSDEEIRSYIATGEPFDKAGGYGIQGRGALLAESITGDYFNVVGLPLSELFVMIKKEFGLSFDDLID